MDKIFSTRMAEQTVAQLEILARTLKTSKKAVLERAIESFAEAVGQAQSVDVLAVSSGAWVRTEPAEKTVARSKAAFRTAFQRHRRDK